MRNFAGLGEGKYLAQTCDRWQRACLNVRYKPVCGRRPDTSNLCAASEVMPVIFHYPVRLVDRLLVELAKSFGFQIFTDFLLFSWLSHGFKERQRRPTSSVKTEPRPSLPPLRSSLIEPRTGSERYEDQMR